MRPLVWFRNDLRVEDNTALLRACQAADEGVIAVFHISRDQWRAHGIGGNKVDFIRRNLAELSDRLAALNIPLRTIDEPTFNDAPGALLRLAQHHGCGGIWFNDEYEVNERRRDEAVEQAFQHAGLECHRFVDQTILAPDAFRTGGDNFYSVFGPYKKKWVKHFKDERPKPGGTPPKQKAIDGVASSAIPSVFRGFEPTADPDLWPAGELVAERRLTDFCNSRIATYDADRDPPALEGTSTLSPYLAVGAISPRRCMQAAIEADGGSPELGDNGPGVWKTEIVWREFYRHVMTGFPRVCMDKPFKPDTAKIHWNEDDAAFEAWCLGRTGFPIVDAAMRQLNKTGWMHNRLRMITAMFLTKDLFIDWRRGEAYFAEHLVDHDFGSNNGGWQWSASTGTDAAPYFRVFNPFSQSERYDKQGVFIKRFVPELSGVAASVVHDPKKLKKSAPVEAGAYPEPIVDRTKTKDRVVAAFKAL